MESAGVKVPVLCLSGPISQLPRVSQTIADATCKPVRVRTNPEASVEGMAVALAAACDVTPPDLSVSLGRSFEPEQNLDAARAAFDSARDHVVHRADSQERE